MYVRDVAMQRRAELLALLLGVLELPTSNLGPSTVYTEYFRRFPQSLQPNCGTVH